MTRPSSVSPLCQAKSSQRQGNVAWKSSKFLLKLLSIYYFYIRYHTFLPMCTYITNFPGQDEDQVEKHASEVILVILTTVGYHLNWWLSLFDYSTLLIDEILVMEACFWMIIMSTIKLMDTCFISLITLAIDIPSSSLFDLLASLTRMLMTNITNCIWIESWTLQFDWTVLIMCLLILCT